MPDYSQFIKLFNTVVPAPSTNSACVLLPPATSSDGHSGTGASSHVESVAHTRLADATWRLLSTNDASAKEGGKGTTSSAGGSSGMQPSTTVLGTVVPTITVGRMMVSTEDRWRIQAAMRREEAKSGQTRKEYNKKVTRAIKVTKGPSGDGFPAGRGRPL